MSEPIKSQIISRRRIFLLAAIAAFAVPATMLPMSNAGAQQAGDQAPADQTPPKPAEKKKKEEEKSYTGGTNRSSEQSAGTTKTAVAPGSSPGVPRRVGSPFHEPGGVVEGHNPTSVGAATG